MSWRGYTWCGATIIAENLVLTAAHCMFDANNNPIPKEEFILRVGDHDTRVFLYYGYNQSANSLLNYEFYFVIYRSRIPKKRKNS